MTPVFLASVTPYVGKNVVALGMAAHWAAAGKSVGFFKPIGPLPVRAEGGVTDEDALFFRKTLKLSEPLDQICPIVLDDQTIADMLAEKIRARDRILSAWKAVSSGKDIVIGSGMGRLSSGLALGYSTEKLIQDTDARVIVVVKYKWAAETLDGILHAKNLMKDKFAGVVFNRIPDGKLQQVQSSVKGFLDRRGVKLLGVIPDDAVLNAVAVSDLVDALGGKVLVGGDNLDQLAEHFSIGAMQVDAAMRIFHRVPNKAVITGGDRSDIQLAALETSTRCLILTGDLHPNERILVRAEELGVPVLLVSHDTSATAEICDMLRGQLTLHSERKISRVNELVEKCLDWPLLEEALGLQ